MKVWTSVVKASLSVFCFALVIPQQAHAIPAFARKYGVKCYACHTIPPALNKNGYMFKRLGYRMPPDEMDGTKPAPKITELDKDIKFNLTNALALVLQGSFTARENRGRHGQYDLRVSRLVLQRWHGRHSAELVLHQLQPGRSGPVRGWSDSRYRLLLLRPL
jgi:hypothetical protein